MKNEYLKKCKLIINMKLIESCIQQEIETLLGALKKKLTSELKCTDAKKNVIR